MNATWNDMNWMQNVRNMRGNGWKMKSDERKQKQQMTSIDSQPRMLSHPQKAGKFTLLVYRELTTWENDKSKTKDHVILGNLKRYGVFIQLQLDSGQFAGKSQLGATLGRWGDPAKGRGVSRCGKEPDGARWTNGLAWLGKRHFPVNHSEVESRPKLEANQQLVRDEAKKNQQMSTNLGFYKLKLADWWCPFFGWWVLRDPWCMVG